MSHRSGSHNLPPNNLHHLWTLDGYQKSLINCTTISPSGLWLASALQDANLVFINLQSGSIAGIIDFESRFSVTAIVWRSDSIPYVGGSNGVVFEVRFTPHVSYFAQSNLDSLANF